MDLTFWFSYQVIVWCAHHYFSAIIIQLCQGWPSSWAALRKPIHHCIEVRFLSHMRILFLCCLILWTSINATFIFQYPITHWTHLSPQRNCCRFWRYHQSICRILGQAWIHQLLWFTSTSLIITLSPTLSLPHFPWFILTLFSFLNLYNFSAFWKWFYTNSPHWGHIIARRVESCCKHNSWSKRRRYPLFAFIFSFLSGKALFIC